MHHELPATPGLILLPTALSPGQYLRARLSLTMATGEELAVSRSLNLRPLEHRDFERAQIIFFYSPVSVAISPSTKRCFAFRTTGV